MCFVFHKTRFSFVVYCPIRDKVCSFESCSQIGLAAGLVKPVLDLVYSDYLAHRVFECIILDRQ